MADSLGPLCNRPCSDANLLNAAFSGSLAQTGCIADQAPLMSRLSSTTAYLLGANVPRLNIFKASNTPSGVRLRHVGARPGSGMNAAVFRVPAMHCLVSTSRASGKLYCATQSVLLHLRERRWAVRIERCAIRWSRG